MCFEALSSDAALALRVYCDRWRRNLLERCATRAASLSSAAPPPTSPPPVSAPSDAPLRAADTEHGSELRIKAAPIIAVTADSKHRG